jgi:fumarylpyruvate hydrolase
METYMPLIFPAEPQIIWPIEGTSKKLPIGRIYCVGRNYADHIREMGHDPDKGEPFFFSKPTNALVANGSEIKYPLKTNNFHYEAELVIIIGKVGTEISVKDADQHIYGFALGIDLTRRDLQKYAKDNGQPWDISKGFDDSAPMTKIYPLENHSSAEFLSKLDNISLSVNGALKQSSSLENMIWSVPEIISALSHYFTLKPGDLIFTGTPEGVGPLVKQDKITAELGFMEDLKIQII